MKKVMITGADGFVGSYTVEKFLSEGCEVLALDMGAEPQRLKAQDNLLFRQLNNDTQSSSSFL